MLLLLTLMYWLFCTLERSQLWNDFHCEIKTLIFFKYNHSSTNRGIMTPFGFCSCKRRRHSTSVSCQSQDLQNQMHAPEEWFPRAQMFVFLWVSSLDELTRVRLFRSLLTRFLGTDQTKLDINTWPGEKEHVLCQSSLFTSVFFYLQAHCFKHRGVKQDYDSSKSVFFSQQFPIIWID